MIVGDRAVLPDDEIAPAMLALKGHMETGLRADAMRAKELAADARRTLNAWLQRETRAGALEVAMSASKHLIESIAASEVSGHAPIAQSGYDLSQWDSAANVYAGLAVLEQGHRARHRLPPTVISPATEAVLQTRGNLADWFMLLKSDSDQATVEAANRTFLTSLLEASRQIQRRED